MESVTSRIANRLPAPVARWAIHRLWPFQEPELRHLRAYVPPHRPALDVGGWWGPWSAHLARWCPSVVTIEPQPDLAAGLRSWAPDNVRVIEAALGAAPGRARLGRPGTRRGQDGLASLRHHLDGEATIEVDVTTVDALGLDDIGFAKIDVEGHELAVLQGAVATIERCRPRLLVEIEARHLDVPIDDVFGWIGDRGYRGYFHRQGEWQPVDHFDVERHQTAFVDHPRRHDYVNAFLFVPEADDWTVS